MLSLSAPFLLTLFLLLLPLPLQMLLSSSTWFWLLVSLLLCFDPRVHLSVAHSLEAPILRHSLLLVLLPQSNLSQRVDYPGSFQLEPLVQLPLCQEFHPNEAVKVFCCFLGSFLASQFQLSCPLCFLKHACLWSSCSWASWAFLSGL